MSSRNSSSLSVLSSVTWRRTCGDLYLVVGPTHCRFHKLFFSQLLRVFCSSSSSRSCDADGAVRALFTNLLEKKIFFKTLP